MHFSSPYLSDFNESVGISTFAKLVRRLPGITGPIPSASLDKGI